MRKTYWPNIDLIPACLALYDAELAIVVHLAAQQDVEKRVQFFMELKYGLQTVADDYDVILLDSPPALGMISINVLMAADALLVPSAARMFDFSSTVQFFRMIHNYIGKIDANKQYRWISVLTTLFDQRYESQKQFCRGDADLLRRLDVPAGVLPFGRGDQLGGAVRRSVRAAAAEPEGARDDGQCVRGDRGGIAQGVAVEAGAAQREGDCVMGTAKAVAAGCSAA